LIPHQSSISLLPRVPLIDSHLIQSYDRKTDFVDKAQLELVASQLEDLAGIFNKNVAQVSPELKPLKVTYSGKLLLGGWFFGLNVN
jgi:hypothetical protein